MRVFFFSFHCFLFFSFIYFSIDLGLSYACDLIALAGGLADIPLTWRHKASTSPPLKASSSMYQLSTCSIYVVVSLYFVCLDRSQIFVVLLVAVLSINSLPYLATPPQLASLRNLLRT